MAGFRPGTGCRFKLRDVICPDRQDVVNQITTDLQLSGEITMVSDAGEIPQQFAVIEVQGITAPLIVPIERLKALEIEQAQPAAELALEERFEKLASEKS